jgi:hypothetical protein
MFLFVVVDTVLICGGARLVVLKLNAATRTRSDLDLGVACKRNAHRNRLDGGWLGDDGLPNRTDFRSARQSGGSFDRHCLDLALKSNNYLLLRTQESEKLIVTLRLFLVLNH